MLSNTIRANQKVDLILRLVPGIITIGRADDNKIIISDEMVSKHHAKIFTYFQASYIEDLKSTNGTFVNDKKVTTHIVHTGDEVMLGKYRIQIIS